MIRLAFALMLAAAPAVAGNEDCADRAQVAAALAVGYGELPRSIGLDEAGNLMELFASPATGTWTLLRTAPGGLTCLVASGGAYAEVRLIPGVDG